MAVIYEYDSTQQELVPVYGSGSSASGGLTPEEHNALMSMASMPARGDVNAEKTTVIQCALQNGAVVYFPIIGYDKISTAHLVNAPSSLQLCTSTGDVVSSLTIPSGSTVWSNYEDIPSNAVYLKATAASNVAVYYSLLTTDSPYNPDNQQEG